MIYNHRWVLRQKQQIDRPLVSIFTALSILTISVGITLLVCRWRFTVPLRRDEVESLHTAWLIYQGRQIYIDFFQHHSPVYLKVISWFVNDKSNLNWVLALRLLTMLMAILSSVLMSILYLVENPKRGNQNQLAVIIGIVFLLLTGIFPIFEIRPEALSVPFFIAAWICLETSSKKININWPRGFFAGLCAGISISLSPRAILPSAALLISYLSLIKSNNKNKFLPCIFTSVVVFCLLLSSASFSNLYNWVYKFSSNSLPTSSIFTTISPLTLLFLLLPVPCVLVIVIQKRILKSYDSHSVQKQIIPSISVFVASCLGLLLEPRQFGQSLTYVLVSIIIFYAIVIKNIIKSNILHYFNSRHIQQLFLLGVTITVAWQYQQLMIHKRATSLASDDLLLKIISRNDDLITSLTARTLFCLKYPGCTVLVEPTELHPICLSDASYYWRGSEYLRAGTLDKAKLVNVPDFNLSADIQKYRPILIGPNIIAADNSPETALLNATIQSEYRRVGVFYLNKSKM